VSLRGKKISLVGCGTIGSYLAHMLVQNGAGCDADFVLYDNDTLKPGNLGRHLLGYKDLGRLKVESMADFLRDFHPEVRITPRGVQALDDWASLEQMDLIIDATGDANFAAALNDRIIGSDRKRDELGSMHAWVFGNGVAAQSFLNLRDGHACYRCLQTEFGGEWRHNPLKDQKSPVRKAPARCGEGGYIPFPGDASIAAARLAVRAALDWVAGNPGHRLRTTIIDKAEGRESLTGKSPKALPRCDACGN
jgi:molybdopterin/thiamine biosynthesis adenylyltransferase